METRAFIIENDGSPLCVAGRLDGHSSGVFLPEATLALVRYFLEQKRDLGESQSESRADGSAPQTSLEDLLKEVLAVQAGTAKWMKNEDVQAAIRELRAMAENLGGDDGPKRG